MRKLVVAVGVLMALGVGGDFALRLAVEKAAENHLRDQNDLKGDGIEITIGDFPFIPSLLEQRLDRATFTAERVREQGVELESFSMELRDISISEPGFRGMEDLRFVQVNRGTGRAAIALGTLERLAERNGVEVDLSVTTSGAMTACPRGIDCGDDAAATVAIDPDGVAGVLVIEGPAPLPPIRLTLPEPVDGVRFDSVKVAGDRVELTLAIRDIDFFL